MSQNPWIAWLQRNGPHPYRLGSKAGWFAYVDAVKRDPLDRLDLPALRALDEEALEDYNECRMVWNSNIPTVRTQQLEHAFTLIDQVMASNRRDGDRLKGAVAIDSPPGLGKTTIAASYGKSFHRAQIRRYGPRTTEGNQRIPVVFVSLTANSTLKALNSRIVEFYGHPALNKVTATKLTSLAVEMVVRCETAVIIVDDLHFVDFNHRSGAEISNHLKWLANELPVTFIYTGVGLAEKSFFSEGLYGESAALAQTARRTTVCPIQPFSLTTDTGSQAWTAMLKLLEGSLNLGAPRAGMLVDQAVLIFERTQGHIASLASLVERCAQLAIATGEESISEKILAMAVTDSAASNAYAAS
ncbi:TniB family NTP-binding protein [Arthrobacter sp. Sr24]